ncbi:hypothetical protein TRAPUB_10659 [Trametes pubescens]|uniref:Uncharacterized protein n=1 Tax=Trametes pubescens TaxID=154538 RepID=A0A1M2VYX8_TRAPU|nr:hypothetical protein TRAPUB_10659 [Trametes pubescens]
MPTAPVDDKGTVLYYEDSGAPPGSTNYITVVLIHGTCFHSGTSPSIVTPLHTAYSHSALAAVYRPMIPFAAERNLRFVLLNLRDYPGSTPYSADDMEDLHGSTLERQVRALQTGGLEIAAFVRWFIETEDTPPIREVSGSQALVGGVSVLAWSGGTCAAVATFAHADKLPEATRRLFDAHLRSFIMYGAYRVSADPGRATHRFHRFEDPSVTVVGEARPPGLGALVRNQAAPLDVQVAEFALTIGSYYPPFALPDSIDPPPVYDPPRRAVHLSADPVDPKYIPTITKMGPRVLRDVTYPEVFTESQHLLWALSYDVYRQNLSRALFDCRFDDGSGILTEVWPALRVHVVWCDRSPGDVLWASAVIHVRYKDAEPKHRRSVEFHKLEDANHFVHWEEPEKFVAFLAGIV